jgi:hypothetical protein
VAAFRLAHIDEIEPLGRAGVPITPVRHHFGIEAFGVNAWVARAAGDRLIPEHTEDSGHEELYIVLRGRARFELDGEERDAPAGTLVHVEAAVKRTAFAEEAGTAILALGGTRGEAFRVGGWELWHPLREQYEAKRYEEIVDEMLEIAEANPQYPVLMYNAACLEALTGRHDASLEHLRLAVERFEQFREFAQGDSDLDAVRDDPRFAEIVGLEGPDA